MKTLWPRALSLRLALVFALVSVLLLGALDLYLYQSLAHEIAWRDDEALGTGALLAFALGWAVSQRGLRPVRTLAARAAAIDVQHLHLRLQGVEQVHELQQLGEALNEMLARLEDGFGRLSRFSEDLAHEMRTPLNNLMGQTQLALQKTRTVEDYQALLASGQEEYERLARMIDNMLFLARAEQPDAVVHREPIALQDAVVQLWTAARAARDLCWSFRGAAEARRARGSPQALADVATAVGAATRCAANATYQSRHPGFAIASLFTTFSMGWPSSSFLMGSSCFLPLSVRGTSATAKMSSGTKRGLSAVRTAPLMRARRASSSA